MPLILKQIPLCDIAGLLSLTATVWHIYHCTSAVWTLFAHQFCEQTSNILILTIDDGTFPTDVEVTCYLHIDSHHAGDLN